MSSHACPGHSTRNAHDHKASEGQNQDSNPVPTDPKAYTLPPTCISSAYHYFKLLEDYGSHLLFFRTSRALTAVLRHTADTNQHQGLLEEAQQTPHMKACSVLPRMSAPRRQTGVPVLFTTGSPTPVSVSACRAHGRCLINTCPVNE